MLPGDEENLQARLDRITTHTRALVQPERLAITETSITDLLATGLQERILPVGASAPIFTLPDTKNKSVRLDDLLALGSVVVKFFRGRWCPYCVTELEAWQRALPTLRERKALLIGISPQTIRHNAFLAEQHRLTFPILSDSNAAVAERFGVAYTVPEPMRLHYRSILVNVPFMNGDNSWKLPLPATFVVSEAGLITYSEGHCDHRLRPDIADALAALGAKLKA